MKGRLVRALAALCATGLAVTFSPCEAARAQEQEPADWRVEFEAVCVKTDLAMSLSSEELAGLVARCDRLAERIGAEGEIVRKVFLRRLQSCRALFAFVLESRGAAAQPPSVEAPPHPGAGAPSPQDPPTAEGRPAP